MMDDSPDNVMVGIVSWLVAVSVVLSAVGIWLGRAHRLRSRRIALVWAMASIAPLFAAGAYMYLRHDVIAMQDAAPPGVGDERTAPSRS